MTNRLMQVRPPLSRLGMLAIWEIRPQIPARNPALVLRSVPPNPNRVGPDCFYLKRAVRLLVLREGANVGSHSEAALNLIPRRVKGHGRRPAGILSHSSARRKHSSFPGWPVARDVAAFHAAESATPTSAFSASRVTGYWRLSGPAASAVRRFTARSHSTGPPCRSIFRKY